VPGPLRIDRPEDGVAVLTLALPERRNAMTDELTAAWSGALADLRADASVRALVVSGEGRAFCAGGDLGWIGESPDLAVSAVRDRMLAFYRTWLAVRDLDVPSVAAVNGPAVGAGLCLALACDLRLASTQARFVAPFVRLGMHPGMAATHLLADVLGPGRARSLLLTGRSVDAAEAERIGLVDSVHEPDQLLPAAVEVARGIAASAPLAVRLTKAALRGAGHRTIDEALAWEGLAQPVTMVSADLREGLAAQAEKRPPRFTGR
jgi:enoyl-CoA hydratase/carnithine racemase